MPVASWRRQIVAVGLLVVVSLVASATLAVQPASADPLAEKRAEANQIADRLAQLEGRLMELGAQYEQASYELHLAGEEVEAARARVEATNADLERRRAELQAFAIQAYQDGGGTPAFDALLKSDADVGLVKQSYLKTASGNRQDLVDALNAAGRAAEEDQELLAEAQAAAEGHARALEQAKADASDAAAEQQAVNDRVQGELAQLVEQERARREAEARAAAERAAAAAAAAAAATSTTTPRAATTRTDGSGGSQTNTTSPRPSSGSSPSPSAPSTPPPSPGSGASGAISAALSKVGAPYVWGSAGPNSFDCSGLVKWAYGQVGVSLPHYSGAQYNVTTRISASQLQPGDLVFWGAGGSEHVAIYMGGDQLVHAFGSNRATGVTRLNGWWKAPSGYGRIS
jgi:cell wall-associated NlpC family hydrolase